jgi:hypothetical protein
MAISQCKAHEILAYPDRLAGASLDNDPEALACLLLGIEYLNDAKGSGSGELKEHKDSNQHGKDAQPNADA